MTIQSQNVRDYLRFFIGYTSFWKNQIYQPSYIYNQKEDRVYNKIYTGDWWRNKQTELSAGAIIILILLASDKSVISLSHRDQILWPIYVTIGNLDAKTCQSQNRSIILLLNSIPIVYK